MSGGKRSGSGRKAVKIDLEQVEKLCGLQCTDDELASFFGGSARTIERRKRQPAFADALTRGRARGKLSLRRNLWGLAAKGNPGREHFPREESSGLPGLLHQRTQRSRRRADWDFVILAVTMPGRSGPDCP